MVEVRGGRRISKGTLSYYRGARSGRSRTAKLTAVPSSDWDWLVGLYYADGCKFKDKWKPVIVFSLSKSDRHAIAKLLGLIEILGLCPSILTRPGTGP